MIRNRNFLRVAPAFLAAAGLLSGPAQTQVATAPAGAASAPQIRPLPAPSLNFYGNAGLVDMPSGEHLPDGQFTTGISYFGGNGRFNLTFQAFPWLSASFRYNGIQNWNMNGFETYYDRGFDLRFRLLKEGKYQPALTLGLQDFAGTGIYAGEYLVATKGFDVPAIGSSRVPGRLKLTAGLGWGRLGSYGEIGTTGTRPEYDPDDTGGKPSYDQWFRGPVAPFGGVEWLVDDRLGLKLE